MTQEATAEVQKTETTETPKEVSAATAEATPPKEVIVGDAKKEETKAEPETFTLKLPEGSKLKPEYVKEIESFAKENKISNEQAQKLLDRDHQLYSGFEASQKALVDKEMSSWMGALQNDAEFGGSKYNETVELAKGVVARFGHDEFKTALDTTGLGNHPELVKVFARIGRAMQNDKFIESGKPAGSGPKSLPDLLYAETTSKQK